MKIQDLLQEYAKSSQVKALADVLGKKSVKTVFLEGLMCSSAPMAFAALTPNRTPLTILFILQDADEAGYICDEEII